MSDCFIRPLTVMEKNNEPDAKDAVLNEGTIQLLRFLLSERKKNDESNCLHNEHRKHREICKDAWASDRFTGLCFRRCKKIFGKEYWDHLSRMDHGKWYEQIRDVI